MSDSIIVNDGFKETADILGYKDSIYDMFKNISETKADSVAIIYCSSNGDDIIMTYGELSVAVDQLAEEIKKCVDGSGKYIAVYMPRSHYTLISILAILKLGNIYVPIDTTFPEEYIEYVADDVKFDVLITNDELISRTAGVSAKKIIVTSLDLKNRSKEYLHKNNSFPNKLTYILYTSGTTGKPKGVLHRQYGLINRFTWFYNTYPYTENDVILQRTNVNFNPSMFEFLSGLLYGIKTVIISDDVAKDIKKIASVVKKHNVSIIQFVPSLLKRVLETPGLESDFSSVRTVITCGEPLSLDMYNKFNSIWRGKSLVNDYGSSESNGVLFFDNSGADGNDSELPGFREISNVTAYIMDKNYNECVNGESGQLVIRFPFTADGYVNIPDETNKKFKNIEQNGKIVRLYNTGDCAKRKNDGRIVILGRSDQQVKIRGIRIELPAVENALLRCSGIKECCVLAKEIRQDVKILVAFLSLKEGYTLNTSDIISEMKKYISDIMIPSRFIELDELPRTANNKVNRGLLKDYDIKGYLQDCNDTSSEMLSLQQLKKIAAELLLIKSSEIDENKAFRDIGFDSLTITDFVNILNIDHSIDVNATDLFSYKTLKEFYDYLTNKTNESVKSDIQQSTNKNEKDKIAVTGLSCRVPGASNAEEFWNNLVLGKDTTSTISLTRWDPRLYYDKEGKSKGKYFTQKAGVLEDVDMFDGEFFGIVPIACKNMDTQQRICLEESYKALEDAGLSEEYLSSKKVGVYVGVRAGDYKELVPDNEIDSFISLGNECALTAGRISYYLNLKGASVTIDTACSSSLVALCMACRSIEAGDIEIAVVCGVNIMNTAQLLISSSQMGILSKSGKVRAFDNNADGTVISEAAGVLVLRKLSDAEAENDRIYGIIEGIGINQDGKSNGISAPNPKAQEELINSVLLRNGIDKGSINYIECHGTGTKLGDPIEVNNIINIFSGVKNKLYLGAVKNNIGHTFTSSGIIGIIKILMMMKHKMIPPVINFTDLNQNIKTNSNIIINLDNVSLDHPITAAINSFGISGTNVHAVISQYDMKEKKQEWNPYYLILLSAKKSNALTVKKAELKEWLEKNGDDSMLGDIAYTLCRGRSHFSFREAYVVDSIGQLIEFLSSDGSSRLFCSEDTGNTEFSDYRNKLIYQAEKYLNGESIIENIASELRGSGIISLPSYPFDRKKYWLGNGSANDRIEPVMMFKENEEISSFKEYNKYSPEVVGHDISGEVLFPASGIINLVFQAVRRITDDITKICIKELILIKPVILSDKKTRICALLHRDGDIIRFDVRCDDSEENYAEGSIELSECYTEEKYNIAGISQRCSKRLDKESIYSRLLETDLHYSGNYRRISEMLIGSNEIFVKYDTLHGESCSESIIDSILQAGSGFTLDEANDFPYIPFKINGIRCRSALSDNYSVYAKRENNKISIKALDDNGNVTMSIDHLMLMQKKRKNKVFCNTVKWEETTLKIARNRKLVFISDNSEEISDISRELCNYHNCIYAGTVDLSLLSHENDVIDYSAVRDRINTEPDDRLTILFIRRADNSNQVTDLAKEIYALSKCMINGCFRKSPELIVVFSGKSSFMYMEATAGYMRSFSYEFDIRSTHCISIEDGEKISEHIIMPEGQQSEVNEYRYINGRCYKKVICEIEIEQSERGNDSTYGITIITGGLGHIGKLVADMAVKEYSGHIVLMGRKKATPEIEQSIFDRWGNKVTYVSADVSEKSSLFTVIKELTRKYGNVKRVFHAAGVIRDKTIKNKSFNDFSTVLAPKIKGIINLDEILSDQPVEIFAVFSSIASIIGNVAQQDYSFANGFMDAYIESKHNGKVYVSVNWPLWHGDGMKMSEDLFMLTKKKFGLDVLDDADGIDVLKKITASSMSRCIVTVGTENYFSDKKEQITNEQKPKTSDYKKKLSESVKEIIHEITGISPGDIDEVASFNSLGIDSVMLLSMDKLLNERFDDVADNYFMKYDNIRDIVNDLFDIYIGAGKFEEVPLETITDVADTSDTLKDLTDIVYGIINEVTGVDYDSIESSMNFEEFGVDSIMLLQMDEKLSCNFAVATDNVFMKSNTVGDVLAFLSDNIIIKGIEKISEFQNINSSHRDSDTIEQDRHDDSDEEEISVIGISCRFPASDNIKEFWNNLCSKNNCISKSENGDYYSGKINNIDGFDPLFFHIPPNEANYLLPQERLFLETAWEAIEDAGYSISRLREMKDKGKKTGVFVGVMNEHYKCLPADDYEKSRLSGISYWSIANRLSYFLNADGPSIAVDSACSSSLTALHIAVNSIRNHECDIAVVGGVNLILDWHKIEGMKYAHLLSSADRSLSLSEGDGYIPGDGIGVVVLERASIADASCDRVYCDIKNVLTRHSGRTKAYMQPSQEAQKEILCELLKNSGCNNVSYYEAAANGLKVGDAIEINGLIQAFSELDINDCECIIGTVKSNIGHLEAASGMSQLIKIALQMKTHTLIPTINADILNSDIELSGTPFIINYELKDWKDRNGEKLTAIINSVGAGGSLACALIQEHTAQKKVRKCKEKYILPLSANNNNSLKRMAKALWMYLTENNSVELEDIEYTLSRREVFRYRMAVYGTVREELVSRLREYSINDRLQISGNTDDGYEKAVMEWINEGKMPFSVFDGCTVVSLPGYCFDNNSYWIKSKHGSGTGNNVSDISNSVSECGTDIHEIILAFLQDNKGISSEMIDNDLSLDNYGLNSIDDKMLVGYIEDKTGVILSMSELYANYSVNGIIGAYNKAIDHQNSIMDQRAANDQLYYLDMFLLDQIENNNMDYNKATAIREEIIKKLTEV